MEVGVFRRGHESGFMSGPHGEPLHAVKVSPEDSLMLEMKFWLLEEEMKRTQEERDMLKAKTKSLSQENAELLNENNELKLPAAYAQASTQTENANPEELHANIETLMREVKDKQLELAMTNFSLRDSDQEKRRQERREKKLQTCEAESETLKRSNDNLRLHLDTLLAKVDELFQEKETETGTNKLLKEENRHLQSLVEVLKNPAEQFQGLSSKVDNLMTRMEREQKREDDELHTLRNVNQKISKRNLQLQEELDVQRKENTNSAKIILSLQAKNRTIHDNMTGLQLEIAHATQNHTSAEVVQTELNEVQAQVDGLKAKLALAVTELDCSGANMRIFTCKHESYTWVSDATKRTQGKDYVWIANDIFRAFGNDPVFLQEYETLRRSIIQHHRAHESTGLGRRAWATNIRNHFRNVDAHWSRAIAISY